MLRIFIALWLAITPAFVWAGQSGLLLGVSAPGPTYQGPADIVTGITGFWSCARAADAALATTSTNLCDLVQSPTGASPGTAVGTLRASAAGTVDLSAYFAGSVTPSAACGAVTGGCVVSKAYNQMNPGTLDMVQATNASQIPITFASLNGLPVLASNNAGFLASNTTATQALPISLSVLFKRTSASAGGYLSASNVVVELRGSGSANTIGFSCGSAAAETATDSQWDALNSMCSSTAGQSTININGTSITAVSNGNTALSASTLQIAKAEAGTLLQNASIAEAFYAPIGYSTTQEGQLCTNQKNAYALSGTTC